MRWLVQPVMLGAKFCRSRNEGCGQSSCRRCIIPFYWMEVSYGEEDVLKVDALDDFDFSAVDMVLSSPAPRSLPICPSGGGGRGGCDR